MPEMVSAWHHTNLKTTSKKTEEASFLYCQNPARLQPYENEIRHAALLQTNQKDMEENVSRVPYLKETYEMLRMHIYPNCIKTRTVKSEYSTRTVERTILEGDRVCILNVFIFKFPHDKSCNYLTFFYFLHTTTFWETV